MIRHAELQDLEAVQAVYAQARKFMAETGNPNQWGKTHPPRETLETEPTYQRIDDGAWLSDASYGVIHMVASDGTVHGFLQQVVAYCEQQTKHLRIDTHHDNKVMQHVIGKNGFTRCGVIYLEDGDPRIAYEKLGE